MKNLSHLFFLLSLSCIISSHSFSQVHLVKDINPSEEYAYSIQVWNYTEFNDEFYFVAYAPSGNSHLWKTNGTLSTTIQPDLMGNNGNIHRITTINNSLIFAGEDINGIELWKSDGTPEETELIKDLSPGSGSGDPCNFNPVDGFLFFTANFNGFSYELWKTDGTSSGTQLIKIIPATFGYEAAEWFTTVDDLLLFRVQNGSTATLWRSDGTDSGTHELQNSIGEIPTGISIIHKKGNLVYFTATLNTADESLWITDGTFAGTQQLTIDPVPNIASDDDEVFFVKNDSVDGKTFWKTDGTTAGTSFVMDPFPVDEGMIVNFAVKNDSIRYQYINQFSVIVPVIYSVSAQTLDTIENCLATDYSYFETENGTLTCGTSSLVSHGLELGFIQNSSYTELADIYPGSNPSLIKFLYRMGDLVYFTAEDGVNNTQLWVVNATNLSSARISEIGKVALDSDVELMIEFNDKVFFTATDGVHGHEPWISDGTENGTTLIKDINPGSIGSGIKDFFVLNNELYFFTSQPVDALYKTDGTAAGTIFIKNIEYAGNKSFTTLDNEFYFVRGGDFANEIWKTDGTSSGTVFVAEVFPSNDYPYIIKLWTAGGSIFFQAYDGDAERRWFKSDGTQAGTAFANPDDTDITFSLFANHTLVHGNDIISTATNGNTITIYSLNETTSTATVISEFEDYDEISELKLMGDYAYLVLTRDNSYRELWKVDLTTHVSTLLLTNNNGLGGLAVLNDTLFFTSFNAGNQLLGLTNASNSSFLISNQNLSIGSAIILDGELCYTGNFTPFKQVPVLLNNSSLYPVYSSEFGISAVGQKLGIDEKLFFTAKNDANGFELWLYDKNQDTLVLTMIDTVVCNNYLCDLNNLEYNFTGYYFDTLQDINGEDSLKLIINLIVNHSIPSPIINAPYIFPTDTSYCNGFLYMDVGTSDLHIMIDSTYTTPQSNEVVVMGGLCHGIHTISIADSCGYSYQSYFVIPYPNETIYNISDNDVLDSMGYISENCVILYDQIDTAYISSITVSDTIATVVWTITDDLGNDYLETAIYNLTSGTGNYIFQISFYCPTKSVEKVFAVTQNIYGEVGVTKLLYNTATIFPNPTTDQVTISFESTEAILTIYDAQGKLIQNRSIIHSGEQVSLANVQTGVYFFELSTGEGKVIKRVIKD